MSHIRSRNVVRPMIGFGAARIEVPPARDDRLLGSIPGPRSVWESGVVSLETFGQTRSESTGAQVRIVGVASDLSRPSVTRA